MRGKQGPWSLGFLVSDDRSPGKRVTNDDPLHGKRAYFAIGRVSHDFGEQSSLGAFYTERRLAGYFNRVGGIDANFKLGKNWSSNFRSLLSSTYDQWSSPFLPINGNVPSGNQYLFGAAHEAMLTGKGRRFEYVGQFIKTLVRASEPKLATSENLLTGRVAPGYSENGPFLPCLL